MLSGDSWRPLTCFWKNSRIVYYFYAQPDCLKSFIHDLFLAVRFTIFLIASMQFKFVLSAGSKVAFHLLCTFRALPIASLHFFVHQGVDFLRSKTYCFCLKNFRLVLIITSVTIVWDMLGSTSVEKAAELEVHGTLGISKAPSFIF